MRLEDLIRTAAAAAHAPRGQDQLVDSHLVEGAGVQLRPARAGNRRVWLLSALRANAKAPRKPIYYGERLGRLNAPGGPGPV